MFTEALKETVESILMLLLTAIIPTLVGYGVYKFNKWFKAKTKVLDSEYAINMFEHIGDTIESVVNHTTKTFVESLKRSNEFDAENKIEALKKSKTAAISMLDEESTALIQKMHGDLNNWVETQIISILEEQGSVKLMASHKS